MRVHIPRRAGTATRPCALHPQQDGGEFVQPPRLLRGAYYACGTADRGYIRLGPLKEVYGRPVCDFSAGQGVRIAEHLRVVGKTQQVGGGTVIEGEGTGVVWGRQPCQLAEDTGKRDCVAEQP